MLKLLEKSEYAILASAMNDKYTIYLDDRSFYITAEADGNGIRVVTTLSNQDGSYHYPVEARILHDEENLKPRKATLFLIDYIDAYFEDYLTELESTYLRIDWSDVEYEGVEFQMRGQVINRKVEEMADKLLESGEIYSGPNVII